MTLHKRIPLFHSGRTLGGSGALAKQIENGAPCDIFFSANMEWVDYLKEKKLVDAGTIATFAFNELVFVGKPGLKAGSLEDVVKLKKIAIGSPKSVPAGQYAMEAFKKAGVDTKLEGKLVMAKDVRECLMYAERGEVDGAFVYKTDAGIMARNVKILFIVPQALYPRVTYLVALTVAGAKKNEAAAFYKFMQSAKAKKVLIQVWLCGEVTPMLGFTPARLFGNTALSQGGHHGHPAVVTLRVCRGLPDDVP